MIIQNKSSQVTYNELPQVVSELRDTVMEMQNLLKESLKARNEQESDRWLDLNEFCDYDPQKPSKATAYSWVSKGILPNHKRGKKLFFLKSEIDSFLKSGRRRTVSELQVEKEFQPKTSTRRGGRRIKS